MELRKSHWGVEGNRVNLTTPIVKVDEEKRQVSGFATLDNIDTSDDVVLADASSRAFSRFRGNIREMHEPIAAGRLVDFKEDSFYHDGEFYNGVFVTVYVSKGAESTWQKVLDGTLSGFSIGGSIIDQSTEFSKDAGRAIRFIKDYELIELSLVDSPANQLANVFSIQKNAAGTEFMKGMVTETHVVNVFWCPVDEIAKNSDSEGESCLNCGATMEIIGWFEKGDDETAKMQGVVSKFLRQKEGDASKQHNATGEGGVQMTDEVKKSSEGEATAAEDVVTSEDVAAEAGVEEVASEEAAAADETAAVEEAPAEPDFEKMFDDLKGSVKESIEKTVETVEKKVTEVTEAFDKKASEFEKSLTELSESLAAIKTEREDVAKRLETLENATAIKKSGEVGSTDSTASGESLQKGRFWGSTFFSDEA